MSCQGNKKIILLISTLIIVCISLLVFSPACIVEKIHPLTIENRTGQTLQIYVGLEGRGYFTVEKYFHSGGVPAYETVTIRSSGIVPTVYRYFLIEARTDIDAVLFSQWYSDVELEDMDYTIAIPPPIDEGSLYWKEAQGWFDTNDLARAQAEIPFNIVLPTYIPYKRQDTPLPQIEGPLRISSTDNEAEVIIRYLIKLGEDADISGHVFVTESNRPYSLGDPELDPELELIEIDGKQVVMKEGNFPLGSGVWFSFNIDNIYFGVEAYNLPIEETMKVVKSLIQQVE